MNTKTKPTRQMSALRANPNNPRKITEGRLKELKKALEEFGDLGAVIYNRKSKQLEGGHQRSKIFEKGKAVITEEFAKPNKSGTIAEGYIEYNGEKYKYREVVWDKAKAQAANIAANSNAGDWDLPILSDIIRNIDMMGGDLKLTMLDKNLLEDLIVPTLHPKDAGEPSTKTIKETEVNIKSKKTLEHTCPKCKHQF